VSGADLAVASLLLQPGAASPLPPALLPARTFRVSKAVARKISGLENIPSDDVIVELDLAGSGPMSVPQLRAAFGLALSTGASGHSLAGMNAGQPAQKQKQQRQEQAGRGSARPRALRRLLALEAVQDPGNLGTLLRCAMAFGWWVVCSLGKRGQ
jgi:hypothetical protein